MLTDVRILSGSSDGSSGYAGTRIPYGGPRKSPTVADDTELIDFGRTPAPSLVHPVFEKYGPADFELESFCRCAD